jgi:hypothetical protein
MHPLTHTTLHTVLGVEISGMRQDILRSRITRAFTSSFTFQSDGNLVLYYNKKAVWASSTTGKVGSNGYLDLANNGNLIIRQVVKGGYKNLWSSNTGYGQKCAKDGNLPIANYELSLIPVSNSSAKVLGVQIDDDALFKPHASLSSQGVWVKGYDSTAVGGC